MVQTIPREQSAVLFRTNGGDLEHTKIAVPEPKDDEVLVNVKYSGVCHTDLHAWKGDWPLPNKLPLVGGHEGAGIAVKVGKNVEGIKVGDTVGVKWLNGCCGSCEFCMQSYEPLCHTPELSGFTIDGTFQQYCIGQGSQLARIPKNLDLAKAAPILCAGITVYKGLKESEVKPGQWVCITGAGGGLGHLAVQYAKAMGMRVLAIDAGEDKKQLCESLGAEVFIDFLKTKDMTKAVQDATQGGPHGTLVLATATAAYTQACEYARKRGTVITISLPPSAYLKADIFFFTLKTLRVKGSYVGNRADTEEALDFAARGLVDPHIKIVPLSKLPEIYSDMEKGKIAGRIVLDMN